MRLLQRVLGTDRIERRLDGLASRNQILEQRVKKAEEKSASLQSENATLQRKAYGGDEEASGVPMAYGQFTYEPNTELRGDNLWANLDKMESDPHVKSALYSKTLPLVLAEWEVKPASDDARDEEIAEFVSANLLGDGGDRYGGDYAVQTAWRQQRLPEILSMLRDGFSMFHKSMREVDGKWVYDRLQWLEPSSVDPKGWELDDTDHLIRVKRTFSTPTDAYKYMAPIEAERIALYAWELKGARFAGTPFLRSLWGGFYRKDFMLKMRSIGAQKFGAPIPVGVYPDGWSSTDIQRFQELTKQLRGTSPAHMFGMFQRGKNGELPEFIFPGASVDPDKLNAAINSENMEMSHAAGTKSKQLGETASGSRALAQPLSRDELMLLQAVALFVCGFENQGTGNLPGLIRELVDINFAGVKKYPELVCSKVDPDKGKDEWQPIIAGFSKGIIPKTPDAKRQYAERYGFQLPDEAYEVEEPPPMVPGQPPQPGDDDQPGPEDQPEQGARVPRAASLESKEAFRKHIADLLKPIQEGRPKGGGFRYPNRLELEYVNLGAVQDTYRVGEQDLRVAFRAIKRNMIGDLMKRFRDGKISARNIESQRRSLFKGRKKAHAALLEEIEEVGQAGMRHAKEELKNQEAR